MKSILAKSMSIFFFIFSLLVLIGVILIPYLYENTLIAAGKQKSMIQLNNVDLWGRFPGKLNTVFQNQFNFFNLENLGSDENSSKKLNVSVTNQTVVLDQEIAYEKFEFDPKTDTVEFEANSNFKINKNLTSTTEVSTISQGLLELLFSLTYPTEYQKGLNSLYYLLHKAFGTSEDFILKLYTVYTFQNLISKREKVEQTIFKNLGKDKIDLIYSIESNKTYTLTTPGGFLAWSSLVGKNEEIKKAIWLSEKFKLTETESLSILGDKSFLHTLFLWFNKDLSFNFKCAKDICDSELILRQLTDASVTKYLNIKNIKILNDMIDPTFYPYQSSPELIEYYNLLNNNNWGFNDINLSNAQLQKLFFNEDTTLLEPSNLIDLIYFNTTQDLYAAYNKFLFKSNKQINFVTGYIFEYLVNIFVYDRNFLADETSPQKTDENVEIDSLAHGFTSILEVILNRTYYKLRKDIKLITISYFIDSFNRYEIDCLKIILPAVDNNTTRANSICHNEFSNFGSYKSIKNWVLPSECIHFDDCREAEKKYLMELTGMTLDELAKVYNNQNFGKFISDANRLISQTYKCGECTSEFLAHKQWFESYVTKNIPKTYPVLEPSSTIFAWDNIEFQYPIEINYYAEIAKCGIEDCNESSYEKVLSLFNTSENSTSFDRKESYANKFLLQKAYSFYLNNQTSTSTYFYDKLNIKNPDVFFNTLKLLISNTIMKNRIVNNYKDPSSLLFGNYIEDEYFLKFLAGGSFYENFKPNIKSTTGFYINVDRKYKQDNLTVDTGFKENEYEVRRIRKFNGVPIININSRVYSPNKHDYIYKNIPLYDSFRFDSSIDFFDGFQFSTERDFLYFYDNLSSRVLKFKYSKSRNFKENLNCKEYVLTNEVSLNLNENKIKEESVLKKHPQVASIYGKFNKPYVISPFTVLKNQTFLKSFNEIHFEGLSNSDERFGPSYICIDPFSNIVLQSNITLVYSIYTGKLNHIVKDFPENTLIPLFTHTRSYEIDINSYNQEFPGINDFAKSKFISLIIGLVFVLVLLIISIYLCMRYKNAKFVFIGDKKLILE